MPVVELTGEGAARGEGKAALSFPRLKGSGAARASGTGAISGPAHLKGSGAARGFGQASELHRRYELTGSGSASAEGTGFISLEVAVPGEGSARAEGVGWLTWTLPPAVPASLYDAWRYGATRRKAMRGEGKAMANGTGEL